MVTISHMVVVMVRAGRCLVAGGMVLVTMLPHRSHGWAAVVVANMHGASAV